MSEKPQTLHAFPISGDDGYDGMTLRDYFAGQALPSVISQCSGDTMPRKMVLEDYFAAMAYAVADAMLLERERNQ